MANINLHNVKFLSDNHVRYEYGVPTGNDNKGSIRGIQIDASFEVQDGYIVSISNMYGTNPVWGDNLTMSPKPMKITKSEEGKILLKGYGSDVLGTPFSDYGITIHHNGKSIEKIILHMFDRNTDIEYIKSKEYVQEDPQMTAGQEGFKLFKRLKKEIFAFNAKRCQIWREGCLTESKELSGYILAALVEPSPYDVLQVNFEFSSLVAEIESTLFFDYSYPFRDKLIFATLPSTGNEIECIALVTLRMKFGASRPHKKFRLNEPYCCSISFTNSKISQLSFSFNNPEKLIEFYL